MSRLGPNITFGMIVLNGMPFVTYNVRALYPFAGQIIVVEGAAPGAAAIAAPDGHSRDGTLEELRRFAREEDPAGKLVIVTAEDEGHEDGFWPGEKDEQSRAYAVRATGDYLWQVDVDEFYHSTDMQAVVDRLAREPQVTAVTFPTITHWARPAYVTDGWYLRRGAADFHRLFKWGPGYSYAGHRPPTVLDDRGRDTRSVCWLDAAEMARRGIHMHHYSLLLPAQVRDKVEYYSNWGLHGDWFANERRWFADSYLTLRKPYRVHNVYRYPSWLERYEGAHPAAVVSMMSDLAHSAALEMRPVDDAEALLRSPVYRLGRSLVKLGEPCDHWMRRGRRWARRLVRGAAPGRVR